MKFTVPFAVLASALAVSAAPVAPEAAELEPRQANPYAVAFISSAASALVSKAVDEAVGLIGDISDWNGAREKFTQKTTDAMWQSRPSQAGAAVCYNKAYVVSNRNSMSDLTSVELKKGPLHTDYDCFYMWGPDNHFNSQGDGGYINLSVTYDKNKCQFDSTTSDVYCR